ncbi:MAG: hypothetical protein RJA70_3568 [Pseudomonadota bacterium]
MSHVIIVPAGIRKVRVDKLLSEHIEDVSRATIQRWIGEGRVLINGRSCRAKDTVSAGASLDVTPGEAPLTRAEPEPDVQFEVLYDDEHLVVVNKPAGLVVHPARGHQTGTLINGLLARPGFGRPPSDERDSAGYLRPGLVHRIDKDTSGILVVAKDAKAREGLKAQFAAHSIERRYLALTLGVPKQGRIETGHGRHPRSRLRFTSKTDGGRRAVTHVALKQALAKGTALVECRLETGRTHQIRVHLAEQTQTPILADALYGRRPADSELLSWCDEIGRQALHAHVLGIVHPHTGAALRFEAPLPADMALLLGRLAG